MMDFVAGFINRIVEIVCRKDSRLFVSFLRKKGAIIGDGTTFFGSVEIDLTRPCLVEIGKNCVLTDSVRILTHGYDWAVLRDKYGEMLCSSGKVVIGDNVFIGTGSIILKGVRIGSNTIVGAGSVVTKDIPSNSVAMGNPCKVRMSIGDYYKKRKMKYVEEAKLYAFEIYRKTKKIPKREDFWEEFPLFLKGNDDWGRLPVEKQLGKALADFLMSRPRYGSFEEFLIDAGIPKEEIEKQNVQPEKIPSKVTEHWHKSAR
jgi:acetyltransferase-like isoleucine patch superfamily enzyme